MSDKASPSEELSSMTMLLCKWSGFDPVYLESFVQSPNILLDIQGAVAAWVQEGQEELLHIQGQEGRP